MILSKKPLTFAEVKSLVKNLDEKLILSEYLKKFNSLSNADATKLADAVRALNNPKIKEENIVKIVDFLPSDSEDINKIFNEASLSEEETHAILNIVKEY